MLSEWILSHKYFDIVTTPSKAYILLQNEFNRSIHDSRISAQAYSRNLLCQRIYMGAKNLLELSFDLFFKAKDTSVWKNARLRH